MLARFKLTIAALGLSVWEVIELEDGDRRAIAQIWNCWRGLRVNAAIRHNHACKDCAR